METSRKQYWVQTAKLIGVVVVITIIEILYLINFGGTEAEINADGLDLIAGIAAIVAAVMLYKGYGFFRGWGGLIVAKVAIYVPLMLFIAS